MRKALKAIAKSIAVVFIILFVITALLTLPLSAAGWRLFGPNLYKRALAENDVYTRAPALAGEQIIYSLNYNPCAEDPDCQEGERGDQDGGEVGDLMDSDTTPYFLSSLTQEDFESIITDLAPPQWLQEQAESAIDQVFGYLNLGNRSEVTVSLVELKERLAGEEGIRAFMRMAMAQPLCTPEQVGIIESDEDIAPEDMPICRPSEQLKARYTAKAQKTLQAVTTELLDEASVITLAEGEGVDVTPAEESGPFGNDPRVAFQIAKWGMRLSPLLPITMLLLATLVIVRSRQDWARWWSVPLLIVGIAGLVLALAALPANWALGVYIAEQAPPEFTQNLVNAGLSLEKFVARAFVTLLAVQSGILTLLGLLLRGVLSILEKRRIEAYDWS
ncbi:MAG: hypothetical protein JW918_18035 [Anaerolineae bacterium]|nr:hypothetical protein [Anaerolineae bacterium]